MMTKSFESTPKPEEAQMRANPGQEAQARLAAVLVPRRPGGSKVGEQLSLVPDDADGPEVAQITTEVVDMLEADAVFRYDEVEPEVAEVAKRAAEMVRTHQADAAVWCGQQLLKAKEALGHGNYVRWLRDELNIKPRTAQSLMNVAEVFGSKAQAIAFLPQTVLYTLSAPSTPEPVRTEMLDRIRNGEKLSTRQVDDIVKQRRAHLAEVARLAKLTEKQREEEQRIKHRAFLKERRSEAGRKRHDDNLRRELDEEKQREQAAADELLLLLRPHFSDPEIGRICRLFCDHKIGIGWRQKDMFQGWHYRAETDAVMASRTTDGSNVAA